MEQQRISIVELKNQVFAPPPDGCEFLIPNPLTEHFLCRLGYGARPEDLGTAYRDSD
jgi:hypothetical protein